MLRAQCRTGVLVATEAATLRFQDHMRGQPLSPVSLLSSAPALDGAMPSPSRTSKLAARQLPGRLTQGDSFVQRSFLHCPEEHFSPCLTYCRGITSQLQALQIMQLPQPRRQTLALLVAHLLTSASYCDILLFVCIQYYDAVSNCVLVCCFQQCDDQSAAAERARMQENGETDTFKPSCSTSPAP